MRKTIKPLWRSSKQCLKLPGSFEHEFIDAETFAEWGKRRLAYPIQDYTEGYYVVSEFEANTDFPAELDRVMKISDDIIRHMITRKEA